MNVNFSNTFSLNINFSRAKVPVCVIFEDGTIQNFENQTIASKALNISPQGISLSLKRQGIINIKSKDGETKRGKLVLYKDIYDDNDKADPEKLKKLLSQFDKNALYVIGQDGRITRCKNSKEASLVLDTTQSYIDLFLSGKISSVKNSIILRQNEATKPDEEGNTTLDIKKIQSMSEPLKSRAVYIIRQDGSYVKCKNQAEACKILEIDPAFLNRYFKHNWNTIKGSIVVKEDEITSCGKDGISYTDEAKIQSLLSRFNKQSVFVLQKNGECKKCTSCAEASQFLKASYRDILKCSKGLIKTVKDAMIIKYDDISTKDAEYFISKDKLISILKERQTDISAQDADKLVEIIIKADKNL